VSKEIQRWADSQQYAREPIPEESRRKISVSLLNATPDPLGSLVALNGIYTGKVIRNLSDPRITDETRRQALEDMLSTTLSGPLESVQFHFLIEGVTRSITHQMVRSRFSFFAQESLRFAVPDGDWAEEIPLPPYLSRTHGNDAPGAETRPVEYARNIWDEHMQNTQRAYQGLINCGMPAEEARGILPHDMPTRIHWVMDLRTLLLEAGKRTCTQAQFPWRIIFGEIAKALREYGSQFGNGGPGNPEHGCDEWQFHLIADKIRPVCYQVGRCTFMAQFDRDCSIRGRVDQNAKAGRPSSEWHDDAEVPTSLGRVIPDIQDWEWAADPAAARRA